MLRADFKPAATAAPDKLSTINAKLRVAGYVPDIHFFYSQFFPPFRPIHTKRSPKWLLFPPLDREDDQFLDDFEDVNKRAARVSRLRQGRRWAFDGLLLSSVGLVIATVGEVKSYPLLISIMIVMASYNSTDTKLKILLLGADTLSGPSRP